MHILLYNLVSLMSSPVFKTITWVMGLLVFTYITISVIKWNKLAKRYRGKTPPINGTQLKDVLIWIDGFKAPVNKGSRSILVFYNDIGIFFSQPGGIGAILCKPIFIPWSEMQETQIDTPDYAQKRRFLVGENTTKRIKLELLISGDQKLPTLSPRASSYSSTGT
jgi:hypothetical protein